MKKVFLVLFSLTITMLHSQQIASVLAAGKEDGSIYLGNYLQPVFKGLIYDLSGGWYHTGKTHKKLGFDVSVNVSAAIVPDNEKTFTFNNADYNVLRLESGLASDDLPTVMGKGSDKRIGVRIPMYNDGDTPGVDAPSYYRVTSFKTMNGIEDEFPLAAAVPAPMVQLGIGLFAKTDIKIRYVPSVESKGVSFSLYGLGLQHNLLQHFKFVDKIPIIDVSLLGGYTTSTSVYTRNDETINGIVAKNQETTFKVNSYTAQVVGNVNLKVISFYAGLGYVAGSSTTTVKGDFTYKYSLEDASGVPIPGGEQTITIHDPINLEYDVSGMKTTVGMRLSLLWFKIFADYTIQEYNTVNAGVAFSFR